MAKEEEKLDIEDIKDPLDQLDETEEELDLEEAVDEEPTKEEAEESEEDTKESEEEIHETEEEIRDEQQEEPQKPAKKGKSLLKKKEKIPTANILKPVKPKKKKLLASVLLILFTALITTAAVLGVVWYLNKDNKQEEPKEEVVATEEQEIEEPTENIVYVNSEVGINLRKEPSTTSEILIIIPNGTKLDVLDENAGWYKVEYQSKQGWVSKEFVTQTNPAKYTNTDYNFSLTFPDSWAGYKAVKKTLEGTTAVYYFGLNTTDTTWMDPTGEDGFASFFTISVYTASQWEAVESGEGSKPTKLGESGGYVFGWTQGQATPSDLSSKFSNIKSIIDTFKLNS